MSRRFFVPRESISGEQVTIADPEARHLAVVLRLEPGDRVTLFDGSGVEYDVVLDAVAPGRARGHVIERRTVAAPSVYLTLVQGVPKGAKMDAVIRMATEVGVGKVIPVLTARSVASGGGRADRWRRIAVQAAKQSRRATVPVIEEPVRFEGALERSQSADLRLILSESERDRTIAHALRAAGAPAQVAVIVGPEGGFTSDEVAQATGQGAVPVTLGPLILRTETAGIVALSMVLYELTLRKL